MDAERIGRRGLMDTLTLIVVAVFLAAVLVALVAAWRTRGAR